MTTSVTIAGAGIGGLTTAIALGTAGCRVHLLERVSELSPVGAGIVLPPNAVSHLSALGLLEGLRERGLALREMRVSTDRGRVLSVLDGDICLKGEPTPMIAIHRGELHALLLARARQIAGVEITLGDGIASFREDARRVTVRTERGSHVEGDILIGADGIHSRVRAQLWGDQPPRYAGYTCWRGVVQGDFGLEGRANEAWGRGRRFGMVPLGNRHVYWFAVKNAPADLTILNDSLRSYLLSEFENFIPPVRALLEETPLSAIVHHDIVDRPPRKAWGTRRVTLLGDAAHPMTPNMGQGAAQAIEDAGALMTTLSAASDPGGALAEYERVRLPRANRFVRRSHAFGVIAQWEHPWACALRDTLTALTPDSSARRAVVRDFEAGARPLLSEATSSPGPGPGSSPRQVAEG